ncbi:Alpha/Beta hydrolase protein [Dipodascopsis tothii]|uniref:Alpha/Beta hydrolase protein n=1 Tax=Dipodascopsis tothii TaxID=44089 RepID=UPI0034CE2881
MSLPCDKCIKGTIHKGQPVGTETPTFGLETYVTSADAPKGTVVMLADIFGWKMANSRLLADAYAKEGGYRVYLPDLFPYEPISAEQVEAILPIEDEKPRSFLEDLYYKVPLYAKVIPFLFFARASVSMAKIKQFVEAAKDAHPDEPVYVVGFCFGGRHAFMAATDRLRAGAVSAVAAVHPSLVSLPGDFKGYRNVPTLVLLGGNDPAFPPESVDKAEKLVTAAGAEYKATTYEGMPHGFAVRANVSDPALAATMETAKQDVLAWFAAHA